MKTLRTQISQGLICKRINEKTGLEMSGINTFSEWLSDREIPHWRSTYGIVCAYTCDIDRWIIENHYVDSETAATMLAESGIDYGPLLGSFLYKNKVRHIGDGPEGMNFHKGDLESLINRMKVVIGYDGLCKYLENKSLNADQREEIFRHTNRMDDAWSCGEGEFPISELDAIIEKVKKPKEKYRLWSISYRDVPSIILVVYPYDETPHKDYTGFRGIMSHGPLYNTKEEALQAAREMQIEVKGDSPADTCAIKNAEMIGGYDKDNLYSYIENKGVSVPHSSDADLIFKTKNWFSDVGVKVTTGDDGYHYANKAEVDKAIAAYHAVKKHFG